MCSEGECNGGGEPNCDDGEPCTEDYCDSMLGCVNDGGAMDGTDCDADGDLCTQNDSCQSGSCQAGETLDCSGTDSDCDGSCDSGTGGCEWPTSSCDDGDACTEDDTCSLGSCMGGGEPDCDDGDPCTDDWCDPSSGCQNDPNTGNSCDDGDLCTTNDTCGDGVCGGEEVVCEGSDSDCNGYCDGSSGQCQWPSGSCEDGDACTEGDVCFSGDCLGGGPPDCDDGEVCTEDYCDFALGCVNDSGAMDSMDCDADGDACTQHDSCQGGTCQAGETMECLGENGDCDGYCDSGTGGCEWPSESCEDGDACTEGDTCAEGACIGGGEPNCDDGDPCTDDWCDPASGCQNDPNTGNACDDGDLCTTNDTCGGGECGGEEVTCFGTNGDCAGYCDGGSGECVWPTSACEDGDACTEGDSCMDGNCLAGEAPDCDDGELCTDDYCDAMTGCVNDSAAMDNSDCDADGDACTQNDSCQGGSCQIGEMMDCSGADEGCGGACDSGTGECQWPDGGCEDGDACTEGDLCAAGACIGGGEPNCDDGDPCTDDWCDPASGCQNDPNTGNACDDGDLCTTNDTCGDGQCGGQVVTCFGTNGACDGFCDGGTGECQWPTDSCEDGDACTEGDMCLGGDCIGGDAPDCDDGELCTEDSCDAMTGCVNDAAALDATACDADGDACTQNDSCQSGTCQAGETMDCAGTDEDCGGACDSGTGECQWPEGGCEDGDACTEGDACAEGACIGGGDPDCDDGDPCTDDWCDPAMGCQNDPNTGNACDDGDLCTTNDVCGGGECGGEVVDCSGSNAECGGLCDAGTGECQWPTGGCEDGDPCTEGDSCAEGACVGGAEPDCDDGELCTEDYCDSAMGCVNDTSARDGEACDADGDACTQSDSCQGGSCQAGVAMDCSGRDGDCDGYCDSGTGDCQWPTDSCDDGNACTTNALCDGGGRCVSRTFVNCNDKNVCTSDSCDPESGCVFEPLSGTQCNDFNLCTNSDICVDGACVGEELPCAVGDLCQGEGVCNPATSVCDYPILPGDLPVPIDTMDLGTLGGLNSRANALNSTGIVVGRADTATGASHAFVWTEALGMTDITPDATAAEATGVNEPGLVVGLVTVDDATSAFGWTADSGLVTLFGGDDVTVLGPNASGMVAGHAGGTVYVSVDGISAATTVTLPEGAADAEALALGEGDHVVGRFTNGDGETRAFWWSAASGLVDVTTLSQGEAVAVNAAGEAVGMAIGDDGRRQAYIFRADDDHTALGNLGGDESWAVAINDMGVVVGLSTTADGQTHGFVWTAASGMRDLGSLGGASSVLFVNEAGMIAGHSDTVFGTSPAVVWMPDDSLVTLGLEGAVNARPIGLTDTGLVAGVLETAGGDRAFVWDTARGTEDLGTLGGATASAVAVNANGQVVGVASDAEGSMRAFISAVPETACIVCEDDTEPPVIYCPQVLQAIECASGGVGVELGRPSVSDACGRAVGVVNDAPESYESGATNVTYTATDSEGNAASCTTTVVVEDTTPPVLDCPEALEVQADEGVCGATVTLPVTATDGCDGDEVTIFGPNGEIGNSASLAPGLNEVNVTAVDKAGNSASCTFPVNVVALTTIVIACEEDLVVEAPADFCGWPEAISAQVLDGCGTELTIESASEVFQVGITDVDFSAENPVGDTAACTTRLTVLDVTAPTIDCGRGDALQALPAVFSPTALDACGVTTTLTNARCLVVNDAGETTVIEEGCEITIEADNVLIVTAVPAYLNGVVVPVEAIRVAWDVTAVDPSDNTETTACEAELDLARRDRDQDGIIDVEDNCADMANADQSDVDLDGNGDVCDETPIDGLVASGSGCQGGGSPAGAGLLLLVLMALALRATRRARKG